MELASNAATFRQTVALVIITKWKEFRSSELPSLRQALLLTCSILTEFVARYQGIGRPTEPEMCGRDLGLQAPPSVALALFLLDSGSASSEGF